VRLSGPGGVQLEGPRGGVGSSSGAQLSGPAVTLCDTAGPLRNGRSDGPATAVLTRGSGG
jgi:hypothetical protein